nr:hypothetical protein [uncultured Desulfobacter sp.]
MRKKKKLGFEDNAGERDVVTSTVDMNETQLVTASLDGDADAYRRLVERYQGRIASRIRRFTRDPVMLEERVQDVFVQA